MKELTKLVLESGLLDRTTAALMERWGQLDPGSSDLVTQKTEVAKFFGTYRQAFIKERLEDFIEELELLLQPEAIERDVTHLDKPDGEK